MSCCGVSKGDVAVGTNPQSSPQTLHKQLLTKFARGVLSAQNCRLGRPVVKRCREFSVDGARRPTPIAPMPAWRRGSQADGPASPDLNAARTGGKPGGFCRSGLPVPSARPGGIVQLKCLVRMMVAGSPSIAWGTKPLSRSSSMAAWLALLSMAISRATPIVRAASPRKPSRTHPSPLLR